MLSNQTNDNPSAVDGQESGDNCRDEGRAFFYEYIGRFFEKEPSFKRAPSGTPCKNCGATDVPLWTNDSGHAVCRAQLAITSKRVGRKSKDEPVAVPGPKDRGKNAFIDGNLVVAGPHVGKVFTKLQPTQVLPDTVDLRFPQNGDRARVIAELMRDPPPPPFVVLVFGQNADGVTLGVTKDVDRIAVTIAESGGYGGNVVNRPYVLRLFNRFSEMSWTEVSALLASRHLLALDEGSQIDRERMEDVLGIDPDVGEGWGEFPSPETGAFQALGWLLRKE